MSPVIMIICGFGVGMMSAVMGYPLNTWQYWVLLAIVLTSYFAGVVSGD